MCKNTTSGRSLFHSAYKMTQENGIIFGAVEVGGALLVVAHFKTRKRHYQGS